MKLKVSLWKEDDMYVIKDTYTGVATQGSTIDEAFTNIREATSLYLEEISDTRDSL